ncbi:hypothetical protein N657DRAFT_32386 [Parathielavia appendiculata]|uniref:RING-type domain-containing protein n=1 Tax=Parathielavia appendiculata TaxID=2587402 RepID=A0AAN6U9Y6_9PEZI|nr:hypothetical protein N657DRAFT_32386 [Parathielavia appendiculata]
MRNEDGEPINMESMPRPHRRRREKKLMPIDEVNEKFPMQQYKMWVAGRAQEGLSTRGGVSAPPSRANSVRDADGVVPELPKERMSADGRPTTSATATKAATQPPADAVAGDVEKSQVQSPRHIPKESTSSTVGVLPRASTDSSGEPEGTVAQKHLSQFSHDEDDEDDHIDAALPPECMGTSGDTCAICIDTLEDDDYVRGLTCGHAFHASCIDPWLTTRRACCPLCKADYYTPKPRPQGTEGGDGTPGLVQVTLPGNGRSGHRMNMPGRPRPLFLGFGRVGQTRHSRRHADTSRPEDNAIFSVPGRPGRGSDPSPSSPDTPSTGPVSVLSSFRPFSRFRFGRTQNNQGQLEPVASGANMTTTPSQLEAARHNPQS